ncbi:MAG: helix-turn-helix transcriptional regulator [Oscillospiraceae bacterium]|nr:helix-turn-helix transcriptional regulator [Oscillospiraceae bacterium]
MSFGERLADVLLKKSIAQKDFAATLNIAPSTLNGYIKGNREPDFDLLKRISFALGISVDYLLEIESYRELTASELSLITTIRRMDDYHREAVYDIVKVLDKTYLNGLKNSHSANFDI